MSIYKFQNENEKLNIYDTINVGNIPILYKITFRTLLHNDKNALLIGNNMIV